MTKRTRRTLIVVAGVLLLVAVAVFLRSKAPPEAARLLPESEGILYLNLKPAHGFLRGGNGGSQKVPEYQQFIDATGIDWERDLDEAAIALHRMSDPRGPNGPVAYSMVLSGRITGPKLTAWLEQHATARENYAGHTVYLIPSEGRTVRVAQIGYDTVAVSNTPTPEQIHSIIDRRRSAALPFAGSTLLSRHFHEVPLLSVAWGVGQIALPLSESGAIHLFGFDLPIPVDATIVASLRWAGSFRLKVEEIAPNEAIASQQAAQVATLITMARGFTPKLGDQPANNGLKEALATAEVTSHKERMVITASLPVSAFAASK